MFKKARRSAKRDSAGRKTREGEDGVQNAGRRNTGGQNVAYTLFFTLEKNPSMPKETRFSDTENRVSVCNGRQDARLRITLAGRSRPQPGVSPMVRRAVSAAQIEGRRAFDRRLDKIAGGSYRVANVFA